MQSNLDLTELIAEIIKIEWTMFSGANNVGGKASCQNDPKTFKIMRTSQYLTWSRNLLQSWLSDLVAAKKEGRNLASEKYARMMEWTFPKEYKNIAHLLPEIDHESAKKVDEIVAIHVAWKKDLDSRYPNLSNCGRNLHSSQDKLHSVPSVETYMRAELQTYSPATIAIYYDDTLKRLEKGRNEAEDNLLNQVKQYGFEDLDAANKYFGKNKGEARRQDLVQDKKSF